jgi:hypothetical protein
VTFESAFRSLVDDVATAARGRGAA